MALRFLMHFLKPNEGKNSWYAFMGNEVAHSSPFLANWFEPHLTQNASRRVALFGFRNTAGGLFDNDDLGATSAWYVWTAMGMYPVIPGVGGVTVLPPRFEHVEISVPGGKSVKLRSSSGEAEDAYIQSVRRDGRETSSFWLTASELSRGVELDFRLARRRAVGVRMLPTLHLPMERPSPICLPAMVRSGLTRETTAQEGLRIRPLTATGIRRGVLSRSRTAARCWRWTSPLHMRRAVFCFDTRILVGLLHSTTT